MKPYFSILLLVSICSCSSLEKFGQKRTAIFKSFTDKYAYVNGFEYVTESSQHCFKEEDERQIYTVNARDVQYAALYFYGRETKFNVKLIKENNITVKRQFDPIKEYESAYEISYCIFGNGIYDDRKNVYASIRAIK